MGEARWRKLHDPHFGKAPKDGRWSRNGTPVDWVPPLNPGERGLVVSASIEVQTIVTLGRFEKGVSRNSVDRVALYRGVHGNEIGGLHPQELRFALLFWERLAWPWSPVFPSPHPNLGSPEVQLLTAEGVIGRPRFLPRTNDRVEVASFLIETQYDALDLLEQRDPGCWSLALGENSLTIEDDEEYAEQCVGMTLHRAVAVPTVDASIDDILEFRLRRRPELLAIRSAIEEAALKISSDADQVLSLRRELERIDSACTDQIRAAKEHKLPLRIGSIDALIQATGAYAGVVEVAKTVLPSTTAQILGSVAASAALGVQVHRSVKANGLSRKTPYDYVGKYHEELFRL